jgi:NarL family two-component system sensor histidine kinase LiaS
MLIERIKSEIRRLQWKLTLRYTAVTVGSLLVVVLCLGYLFFSNAFLPIDMYNRVLSPEVWFQLITENSTHIWRPVLSQEPIDTQLVSVMLQESDLSITTVDLIDIGDFQIQMGTDAQGSGYVVDPDGILLGSINSKLISEDAVGEPMDMGILPGLEEPLTAALNGEVDPERLFVTVEPHESFFIAVPFFDETDQDVLGVAVIYIEHLPTADDIPTALWTLLGRSVIILLLAVGVVGTIFGALTTRGMVQRLERVSQVTDAWSQGDFSEFIEDPVGDEISTLAVRLNHMAEQLQQFLKRSQEMAVSEERNRLARDLHDSAKQEAMAASLHLGTALTLFERDPESAKSHLVEADNLVDSVRVELTDLIHELRPPSMNGARFDETLNEYIIEWAHQSGIEANLEVAGNIDLPLEIKQAIYRIMQEALANVSRHSSADKVDVRMRFDDHAVEFCVNDDGVGFDIHQPHGGMGLDSMRERVESLSGNFSLQSQHGQGTVVCLTIPFE